MSDKARNSKREEGNWEIVKEMRETKNERSLSNPRRFLQANRLHSLQYYFKKYPQNKKVTTSQSNNFIFLIAYICCPEG